MNGYVVYACNHRRCFQLGADVRQDDEDRLRPGVLDCRSGQGPVQSGASLRLLALPDRS